VQVKKRPAFVARESELGQLDRFLSQALAGQGLVCFVTGEAGTGKTALVTEFARRTQEKHEELVVAVGQCDAQTGIGDPYLPFREVLGQLTGDVEAKLAQGAITSENAGRLRKLFVLSGQALVDVGPDLIGIIVPIAGLVTRVGAFVAEKVGWLDKLERLAGRTREGEGLESSNIEQSHIFEQYTNVLRVLADKRPLMLILDDLHWADAASIGLLFRLGRRIGGSRILIVGTYRPEEVAIGRGGERHPLEKVLVEFKRYFGDNSVDLDQASEAEGQHFVDAFLDTEPNSLREEFHNALFRHTGGHPLFTIELLRDLQEQGGLFQDEEGRWIEGPILNWEELPAQVEGVIEERIGRLEQELRQTLTIGCVEGEDFTAEVVASIQTSDARQLIHRLSGDLEKRHRLVSARGVQRLEPSGQCLSLYRFQHNLFQKFLYNEMDEAERVYLHEDVGLVLEELYGDQVDEIVVQLARHFNEAGMLDKARYYLSQAGEKSAALYANDEALIYYGRALELTPENALADRFALLLAREQILDIKCDRDAQKLDLLTLKALASAIDDDRHRAEVALRQSRFAETTSDYPVAITAAQEAILLAQSAQDKRREATGCLEWGRALWRQGDYEEALTRFNAALSLAGDVGLSHIEAVSLLNLGNIRYCQGDFDGADKYYKRSLHKFRQQGNRLSEWSALNNLGNSSAERGNHSKAKAYAEQSLKISREVGDQWRLAGSLNNLGILYDEDGYYTVAKTHFEQALQITREIDDLHGTALALFNLAKTYAWQGDCGRSKSYCLQSIQIFQEIGDRQGEGEVLYFQSLLYHQMSDDETALECGQKALKIAQDIGDRTSQGYALMHLGHALAGLGRLPEAANTYRQSLDIRHEVGQPHLAMESLAGLARISLMQGDPVESQALVEEILSFLECNTLDGTSEPLRVYLTCYRVLTANQDPRAREIMNTAYRQLQERAAKIGDEEMQRSFLENVSSHREIMRAYAN
jgi:tetratricopeptide (TPR) repeat protein